ncbi:tetratricopeptide repeat protein [Streptomyces sp. NPDC006632]|uniref:tetratricopeptide repeat protein n=1 Tax=Streptomyces sp. NPDC006632 TaxID=3157182 RepID=UPI0033BA98C6
MTSSKALEGRPDVLWRMAGQLWADYERRQPITQGQLDAVVEAFFRIGVHRSTEPAQALTLLARAHRLDNANPKHPYHVGLLHLRHGRLDAAVRWLTAAAELSPAHHRIRAHLSLAHRLRDEARAGTEGYDGDDRRLAETIADTIRAGRDDFDPQAEPLVPLLRPGECRWSGIRDMAADGRLRGRTAERGRDVLAVELADIAGLADRRRGGTAAFTVLAVEWLVYGYPAATVRRLAERLPERDGPAIRLLHLVCDLFETDRAELPDRLAACLADGSLPDTLTALIHRQRLFWRPLRFPDLGAHAAARAFRDGVTDGEPGRHEKALHAARKALGAGPPEPMRDVPAPAVTAAAEPAGPDERLAVFEEAAARLRGLGDDALVHAKVLAKGALGTADDFGRVAGDKEILAALVVRLEAVRQVWLAALHRFKDAEPTGLVMEFGEFRRRVEECEALFQQPLGSLRGILTKKVERKLAARAGEFAGAGPVPSAEGLGLGERLAALEADQPSGSGAGSGPGAGSGSGSAGPGSVAAVPGPPADRIPAPAPPPADAGPRERVAHALEAAEARLDANFDDAWRTLDAYPPALRHREAVTLLRAYLGGQQGESDLRLGRTAAARRRWNAMLKDDPVHPGVLRNLAVAHTSAGDLVPAAQAWRRHLEALYLRDLAHGDIRRGAAERAEVHRVLAGSFGTAPLCAGAAPDSELEGDPRDVPPVLASTGKVAIATAHLRLEELNHMLVHRTPTLLLGVARSVGEAELAAARDRATRTVDAAARELPARVREPFAKLCRQRIDDAYRDASQTHGRTRRPGDEAEEQEHEKWVRGRILWRLRLVRALTGADAEWPLTEYSGDVIANLRLVDAMPLDPANEVVLRAARLLGIPGDPAETVARHNQLAQLACAFALSRIYDAAEETSAGAATQDFPERFRRTARSWGRGGDAVPERYADLLDDPTQLYHPSARSAFALLETKATPGDDAERQVVEAAVTGLRRWVARLPGATGPARALARLLTSLDRHDEAREALSAARREAFGERGRQKLAVAFVRHDIDRGAYAEAVTQLRALLDGGSDDERLRYLLIEAYNRWIGSDRQVPQARRIAEDLARWSDAETVQSGRVLVVAATMAAHRDRPDDARLLADELRALWKADPGNVEARYHLVTALYAQAWQLREQIRSSAGAGRRTLRDRLDLARAECAHHATALLGTGEARFAGDAAGSQEQVVDAGPLKDETRRAKLEEILRAVRPDRA